MVVGDMAGGEVVEEAGREGGGVVVGDVLPFVAAIIVLIVLTSRQGVCWRRCAWRAARNINRRRTLGMCSPEACEDR